MAETVKIPIRDLPKYMRELGESFGPSLLAGLTAAAVRAEATLVSEGDRKGVVNTFVYRAGWTHGTAMRLGNASASVRVFNTAPYSGVIELGRRAGRKMPWVRDVPLEAQPIYMWCISKLGMTADEAKKAARPIAWSIKRKGIKGRYVVRDVLGQLAKDGAEEVAKSLRKGMRKVMRARAKAAPPALPSGGS
jgi:hypothetical protein